MLDIRACWARDSKDRSASQNSRGGRASRGPIPTHAAFLLCSVEVPKHLLGCLHRRMLKPSLAISQLLVRPTGLRKAPGIRSIECRSSQLCENRQAGSGSGGGKRVQWREPWLRAYNNRAMELSAPRLEAKQGQSADDQSTWRSLGTPVSRRSARGASC